MHLASASANALVWMCIWVLSVHACVHLSDELRWHFILIGLTMNLICDRCMNELVHRLFPLHRCESYSCRYIEWTSFIGNTVNERPPYHDACRVWNVRILYHTAQSRASLWLTPKMSIFGVKRQNRFIYKFPVCPNWPIQWTTIALIVNDAWTRSDILIKTNLRWGVLVNVCVVVVVACYDILKITKINSTG